MIGWLENRQISTRINGEKTFTCTAKYAHFQHNDANIRNYRAAATTDFFFVEEKWSEEEKEKKSREYAFAAPPRHTFNSQNSRVNFVYEIRTNRNEWQPTSRISISTKGKN